MKNYKLSKSSFIRGLQCHKSLFLYQYHKDWRDAVSPEQQAIFDRGHNVGRLAQQLFPNGQDMSAKFGFNFDKSLPEMQAIMREKNSAVYEAPFLYSEVLSILDILVCEDGHFKAYEVKSSTSVSDTYIYDSALQFWVMTNSGIKLDDFCIIYLNNQYVREGDIDINRLFIIESVLDRIIPLQNEISQHIDEFKKVLELKNEPDMDIGTHCFNPYTCDFHGHCWKHIPEYSIFDIAGLFQDKKFNLYEQGFIRLEDIPDFYPLNAKQWMQVDCELKKYNVIQQDAIRKFLSTLNYPLIFLDFETIMPAVPMFDLSRPYQQIPFQYSMHYLGSKGGALQHSEFLAEAKHGIDPRIPFIESLIKDTEKDGDILVYNIAFERTRLNELAAIFPVYAEALQRITARMKDLMIPFEQRHYYTPEMKGSYSIKSVLPALVPALSYKDLEIGSGGLASNSFESLYDETDSGKIGTIRSNLLKYCELDTLAMVRILEVLVAAAV